MWADGPASGVSTAKGPAWHCKVRFELLPRMALNGSAVWQQPMHGERRGIVGDAEREHAGPDAEHDLRRGFAGNRVFYLAARM